MTRREGGQSYRAFSPITGPQFYSPPTTDVDGDGGSGRRGKHRRNGDGDLPGTTFSMEVAAVICAIFAMGRGVCASPIRRRAGPAARPTSGPGEVPVVVAKIINKGAGGRALTRTNFLRCGGGVERRFIFCSLYAGGDGFVVWRFVTPRYKILDRKC